MPKLLLVPDNSPRTNNWTILLLATVVLTLHEYRGRYIYCLPFPRPFPWTPPRFSLLNRHQSCRFFFALVLTPLPEPLPQLARRSRINVAAFWSLSSPFALRMLSHVTSRHQSLRFLISPPFWRPAGDGVGGPWSKRGGVRGGHVCSR